MLTTFKVPCSGSCICASGGSQPETRMFNASLEYEAGGEKHVEDIVMHVPAGAHIGEIKQMMDCAVRQRIEPKGADNGFLRFRLDGKSADLNLWQWVQDLWFRISWRGTPHRGSHFVPIW